MALKARTKIACHQQISVVKKWAMIVCLWMKTAWQQFIVILSLLYNVHTVNSIDLEQFQNGKGLHSVLRS